MIRLVGLEHGVIVSCGCRWFLWHTYFVRERYCTQNSRRFLNVLPLISRIHLANISLIWDLSLKALPIFVSDAIFAFFGQQSVIFFNKIVHDLIWWTERTKHHSIRSRLFFYAAVKKSPNLLKLWIVFHTIFVIWYPRLPKCIPWKFLLKIFFFKTSDAKIM